MDHHGPNYKDHGLFRLQVNGGTGKPSADVSELGKTMFFEHGVVVPLHSFFDVIV